MQTDLMIDIETLSASPDAAIVTIGACGFNPDTGKIGDTFLGYINPKSAQRLGCVVDADTVMWWMKQSKEAQKALMHPQAGQLGAVMQKFADFVHNIRQTNPSNNLNIWANDPNFDCTILEHSFAACDRSSPWSYYEQRSCRTIKMLGERLGFKLKQDFPRTGTHHSALDDAIYQAEWVMRIIAMIDPDIKA
jgi:inhibitor of KinA sporulation pathway (predicted exonuclease)